MFEHEGTRGGGGFDRFMSRFVDFEATDGGPALDVGAAEPVEPAATPDPTPAPAPAPTPGFSREDIGAVFAEELGKLLQEPEPVPEPMAFDPFNPQSVEERARAIAEGLLQERLSPYQEVLDRVAEEQGKAAANEFLDQQFAGKEFEREPVFRSAAWLATQGLSPADALMRAAQEQMQMEERILSRSGAVQAGQARTAQLEAMHAPGTVTADQPGSAATETVPVPTGPDRYRIQLERSVAAQRAGVPTG